MVKRWLSSAALLVMLGVLVVAYIIITSDFAAEMYTPDQRQALIVHERMRLIQAAPVSNYYRDTVAGEMVVIEADEVDAPGIAATMGATDCRVRATLNTRYEEVEGLTTTVYDLDFEGTYTLRYSGAVPTTTLELIFPFPSGLDTLNQVYFLVDGEEPAGVQYSLGNITWWTQMASGDEREVVVRYRARGVGGFRYALEHNRRLENLDVEIAVLGLTGSEVPDDSLPTTAVENDAGGEQPASEKFTWHYDALIADRDVQIELPTRMSFLQRVEQLRGPMRQLATASPLLVGFFVASLAGVHLLSGIKLPFQHYLLAGLGFFLFYPGLTFLSGVLELPLAATVVLSVITGLLVLFLARAVGWRRTWVQTLLLCAVFLGLFSLGSMSHLRGLLFTTGGLLLVGIFMLLVARQRPSPKPQIVDHDPADGPDIHDPQEGPGDEPDPQESQGGDDDKSSGAEESAEETQSMDLSAAEPPVMDDPVEDLAVPPTPPVDLPAVEPPTAEPPPPSRYCPHCGGPLDEVFAFCPACGHDAQMFRRCEACGAKHYIPPEAQLPHCPACGENMGESANEQISE